MPADAPVISAHCSTPLIKAFPSLRQQRNEVKPQKTTDNFTGGRRGSGRRRRGRDQYGRRRRTDVVARRSAHGFSLWSQLSHEGGDAIHGSIDHREQSVPNPGEGHQLRAGEAADGRPEQLDASKGIGLTG